MPRFDKTGPAGAGPKTGRGRGPCGEGKGMNEGKGFGRRFFGRFRSSASSSDENKKDK